MVETMLEFARKNRVARMTIGRTHQPFRRRWLQGGVPIRLLREAREFDVEIVEGEEAGK